ncbi:gamma-glutamyltransferase family protein [Jannaschia sp. W003]|uniref:gamma-glutamyltransferase family protein n=1 Tax=Jannaschia sp. W003 TaxID=2867012 RepID=UPI0021A8CEFD|nr:gamma-glutamyltransferase family protein [Jannaschia sp. W003]UWQ21445.1 gamma-glutamyltransferase family protein [Jannaschia sp. W003]
MRDFHTPGRSAVLAGNGMCATSHPMGALAAVDVLRRGGNAADAAIAGAVLLGLVEPQMTGLGGDCFALVKPAGSNEVEALNGSGRAPAGANAEALRARGLSAVPTDTVDAVTLPGAVDGFCALAERHGRLGIGDTLGPLADVFEAGAPVAPRVAFDWEIARDAPKGAAAAVYLNGGRPFRTGEHFALPGQAEALRRIAAEGRAGFYEGAVAEDLVASLQAMGGPHTLDDLAGVRADWGAPVSGTYRGTELMEHPPNGQGATAILLANILARFDVAAMDPLGAARVHLEAEATKLAYDARNRILADPDHTARLEHMLSPDTAQRLAALIDPARAMAAAAPLAESVHRDTIYITVVDRDRMAVSLIYSIFHSFGSGLASDRFGILFQNRGAGFSLERGHPNEMAPGKRPMHTIIPGMLREGGRVTMPFGVMGGAYQPAGHARFLSNMADFGMEPQAAIDAPRAFADGGALKVERGYPDAVRAELEAMGHAVEVPDVPLGGAQAIRIAGDHLVGASDPRKDGCALGY